MRVRKAVLLENTRTGINLLLGYFSRKLLTLRFSTKPYSGYVMKNVPLNIKSMRFSSGFASAALV